MEIKLCGVGGQGMGFGGRVLGEAAIIAGLHVAQTTAYGVESRGGLSTSDVIISEDEIYFPEVRQPDVLLIMADKGLSANLRGVHEKTLILYDPGTVNSKIDSPGILKSYPFLSIALKELNNGGAAVIIGLGALIQATGVLELTSLEKALKKMLPERAHELNLKALHLGRDLIAE